MSSNTISVESLIENVEELYELAKLTECKINVPISELSKDFSRSFERNAPKIGAKFANLTSRGRIDEALIVGAMLGVAWLGANVIDLTRNTIATKKAEEALLPMYKEIAVKTQEIICKQSEDIQTLQRLLLEEQQLNVNNQIEIEKLKKRIEKGNEIIQRFMALQAKG